MRKPESPKERNLLKGAMRRIFSRSELRRAALDKTRIEHQDPERPRVTKWSWCSDCGVIEPSYTMEVDHHDPLIPVGSTLDDLTWDEVVIRLWCDVELLNPLCKPCHHAKSKIENAERRRIKKERKS